MPVGLSENDTGALMDLLEECTALITTKDRRSNGAAFFIDEHTLLTCAHVVKRGETVDVTPYKRAKRDGRVEQITSIADGDVALIKIDTPEGEDRPQPAVLIDANADRGPYHAAGFPADEMSPRGLEVIEYDGHPRRDPDSGRLQTLLLSHGQVTFGMSGGPVLNDRSGAVVAIVRYSKDPRGDVGGGAIPIDSVAREFTEVYENIKRPPTATSAWREAVPAAAWLEVGRFWAAEASTFDIHISGKLRRWSVALEPDVDNCQDVTVHDLGEEVADVLFKWAQTRRMRSSGEVELLSKLLSSALLPTPMAERFLRARRANVPLYVRLRVDPSSGQSVDDLANVPWELAAIPESQETIPEGHESFGAARDVRFGRVANELSDTDVSFAPCHTNVPVLAMVVQPSGLTYPSVSYDGNTIKSIGLPAIEKAFNVAIGKAPFRAVPKLLVNPTAEIVDEVVNERDEDGRRRRVEIFHYVGLAKKHGQDLDFAMFDGVNNVSWASGRTFADWIAQSGARVAVIQFMLPPAGFELEAVPPSMVTRSLRPGLHAVVTTGVPVHAYQFQPFNEKFYGCLGSGETVEAAVQAGRRALSLNHPLGDHAGFSWFAVSTGEHVGFRVYAQSPDQATQGAPAASGAAGPRPPAARPRGLEEQESDAFEFSQ